MDGADSDLRADIRWRWSPSAEDKFLAEQSGRFRGSADSPSALAGWAPSIRSGDWKEFRGVDRNGVVHAEPIGTDWERNPPRLAWRERVGPAWSSVIVIGGRLFTQEQRGEQEAVVCYDTLTGRSLWVHEEPVRFWEAVSGAGPRATPTFHDGRIYSLGGTGILNCLDAATGKRYWTHNIAEDAGAKIPQWGFSGSPLLVDGLVIVFAGGDAGRSLLAYRAETEEPAWTASAGVMSYSSCWSLRRTASWSSWPRTLASSESWRVCRRWTARPGAIR